MAHDLHSRRTTKPSLLSALKDNRGNKTYQSRLTRWVDILLPFSFLVDYTAGKTMGFADYFSRHPTSKAKQTSKDGENFVINLIDSFKFLLKIADKISSKRNAESSLEQNDVINAKEQKQKEATRFSHLLHTNQLNYPIQTSQNPNNINVC